MGGHGARSRTRGGEDVQTLRETGTRLATGAGSVFLLGAVAALPLARASEPQQGPYTWLAGLAVAALVAAVALGWSPLVPASLLVVGAVYAAQLAADDAALDTNAALVATGLYLAAELAYWSLEERARVRGEPGEALRRLAYVALLGLAAFVVAVGLLALTDLVGARGLGIDVLGAAAAAAVLLVVVFVARGHSRERDDS